MSRHEMSDCAVSPLIHREEGGIPTCTMHFRLSLPPFLTSSLNLPLCLSVFFCLPISDTIFLCPYLFVLYSLSSSSSHILSRSLILIHFLSFHFFRPGWASRARSLRRTSTASSSAWLAKDSQTKRHQMSSPKCADSLLRRRTN